MLGGWAYAAIYPTATNAAAPLTGCLDYSPPRPHRSLSHQAPIERLHVLNRNNLLGSYS